MYTFIDNFKKKKFLSIFTLILLGVFVILNIHSVNKKITEDDKRYITKFQNNIKTLPLDRTYEDELEFISSIQHATFEIAPNAGSLSINREREPKDIFLEKVAGCFDRSRLIEKILIYNGFKTRHFAIYSIVKTNSSLKTLLTPQIPSHSATEVLTKKGWLIVDSNYQWLSIDSEGNPVSMNKIKQNLDNSIRIDWKNPPDDIIYRKPFVGVYGLYSRHGRFYPPFNFIPDINYGEFIQNII